MSSASRPPDDSAPLSARTREGIIRTVQTPLGFFVLVVLVVEVILGVIAGVSNGSDRTFAIVGILVIISGLVSIVAFLAYYRPEALRGVRVNTIAGSENALEEAISLGAKAIIDASSLPMVLFDDKLLVLHCNDHFASLLDSPTSSILGQHVNELVRRLGERVPMDKRSEFLRRQRALVDKFAADLAPHSEESVIIDNRDLPGNPYHGLYRVRIHADRICTANRVHGAFVVYHVERLTDDGQVQT